jgi:hypothetical protein
MDNDEFASAVERPNTGAEIPAVAPSLIEAIWNGVSRIPSEQRQRVGIGLTCAKIDPAEKPQTPEQHVALMAR